MPSVPRFEVSPPVASEETPVSPRRHRILPVGGTVGTALLCKVRVGQVSSFGAGKAQVLSLKSTILSPNFIQLCESPTGACLRRSFPGLRLQQS